MPRTNNLPYTWYDTPNIHFCTIKDFLELCDEVGAKMERGVALNAWGTPLRLQCAVVVLELVRRAGGVPAEPAGLTFPSGTKSRRRAFAGDGPADDVGNPAIVETDVPARLDRLPWSRFHRLVVVALGITWILDGLEVTLAGSVAGALKASPVLHFSSRRRPRRQRLSRRRGAGRAVLRLADRPAGAQEAVHHHARGLPAGDRRAACRGISGAFALFRFLTGAGIGGEYAAINSTIQELIPARGAASPTWWSTAASGSARRSARSARGAARTAR